MTKLFGIIGYPLTHSFSPGWFNAKFDREKIDARYDAFPLSEISLLPQLLNTEPSLRGLSVTIPYKEKVLPYLTAVDPVAVSIGAVNCIDIREGKLTGYNTDITGFRSSLVPLLTGSHKKALVLGNGGATKAVTYVLRQLGIRYLIVSRNPEPGSDFQIAYHILSPELIADFKLIINTTPLGMHPKTEGLPEIPYAGVGSEHLLYDLVYNPAETRFLSMGKAAGAQIKNGMEMLESQAEVAWSIWSS